MSCNSCTKAFSLLRQEKGCPSCGFSFCNKCLNNKVFLPKLNSEAKVCAKCKNTLEQKNADEVIAPPDAYYKRLAAAKEKTAENVSRTSAANSIGSIEDQIQARLQKLKEDNVAKVTSEEEISKRLQAIKCTQSISDADISNRLAKLRGVPVIVNQPPMLVQDLRTEQEQADDLIKQYIEQTQIDTKYKDEFDTLISDMESRMLKLKGNPSEKDAGPSVAATSGRTDPSNVVESEDEETSVKKIVEKIKAEALMEDNDLAPPSHDELPFCEICNEDATMRCLGCRYLFCKRCFRDHKDDDDCNRYELYEAPKSSQY